MKSIDIVFFSSPQSNGNTDRIDAVQCCETISQSSETSSASTSSNGISTSDDNSPKMSSSDQNSTRNGQSSANGLGSNTNPISQLNYYPQQNIIPIPNPNPSTMSNVWPTALYELRNEKLFRDFLQYQANLRI